MPYHNRIALKFTREEWESLEFNAQQILGLRFKQQMRNNIPHLRSLLNSHLYKLGKELDPDILLLSDKSPLIQNSFPIPEESIKLLEKLALKSGISLTCLIERIVIGRLFN